MQKRISVKVLPSEASDTNSLKRIIAQARLHPSPFRGGGWRSRALLPLAVRNVLWQIRLHRAAQGRAEAGT